MGVLLSPRSISLAAAATLILQSQAAFATNASLPCLQPCLPLAPLFLVSSHARQPRRALGQTRSPSSPAHAAALSSSSPRRMRWRPHPHLQPSCPSPRLRPVRQFPRPPLNPAGLTLVLAPRRARRCPCPRLPGARSGTLVLLSSHPCLRPPCQYKLWIRALIMMLRAFVQGLPKQLE
jgi:hypothetical protein